MTSDDDQILPSSVLLAASASRPPAEFIEQLRLFRLGLEHLVNGLDPEQAQAPGGVEMLAERVAALPDNVATAWRVAGRVATR